MLSSKRFLLISLGLACITLLCPSLAETQNGDSQWPNQIGTSLRVRRFRFKVLSSVDKPSCDEVYERLKQKGFLPLVEKPYDQAKVALIKEEVREIYRQNGIAVDVESSLRPTSSPRAVEIFIDVHKQ